MPPPSIITPASLLLRFRVRSTIVRAAFSPASPASLRRTYSLPTTAANGFVKSKPLLQQLRERELVEAVTGADGALENFIESTPVTTYAGVDPTASSLHVGHLLPLMNLLHFYLNGHHSIALVGKATASVGDPSGRTTERDSIESRNLQNSSDSLWKQIEKFFETGQAYALERGYTTEQLGKRELVTNAEWLDKLGFIEFLSTVGRHARVSQMLARESVKGRMNTGQGINFAEFTYQLLQSYDFWHLHHHKNCRLQIGGNDQFGNITAGIDLIHKLKNTTQGTPPPSNDTFEPAYGLTVPLLTTPSGEKFGKSAGNAVWLDENLTSPFELYQFFVRLPDEVVAKYLKIFTLLPISTVAQELDTHFASPEKRSAQHLLAKEVVTMIHGETKAGKAGIQTRLLFPAPGDHLSFTGQEILENFAGSQHGGVIEVPRDEVVGQLVSKLARKIGAVNTRGEADSMIKGGGLYVGLENRKVSDIKARVEEEWLVDGEVLVVRFGKGRFVIVKVV